MMSSANDFLAAFFAAHPEAKNGKLNLNGLNDVLQNFQFTSNHTPQGDFDGLSAAQMHDLLYAPLSDNCLLRISPSAEYMVAQIPLFRFMQLLVQDIQEKGPVKLTAKGNLPVRVCEFLFKEQLVGWKYMNSLTPATEETVPYIRPLKEILLGMDILKIIKGQLHIAPAGVTFITEGALEQLKQLLYYFGHRYSWENFYKAGDRGHIGHLGWAFGLFLLQKYGDAVRPVEFYGDKIIRAFEKELCENPQAELQRKRIAQYHSIYAIRFFEYFANWFGLATVRYERAEAGKEIRMINRSALCEQLFTKN